MNLITATALIDALAAEGVVATVADGDRVVVERGGELVVVVMDDERREVDGALAFAVESTDVLIVGADGTDTVFALSGAIADPDELMLDEDGTPLAQVTYAITDTLDELRPSAS